MSKIVRVLDLANRSEAMLLEKHLNEKKIDFRIVCNMDTMSDVIFGSQEGWGYVEAPEEFEKKILAIYKEVVTSKNVAFEKPSVKRTSTQNQSKRKKKSDKGKTDR